MSNETMSDESPEAAADNQSDGIDTQEIADLFDRHTIQGK